MNAPNIRSKMMAAVKNKNTAPEINVRKALFAKGMRYKLHNKKLPGNPDLVFAKHKAVIFINGCFWHMHNCRLMQIPQTNQQFWIDKLNKNAYRDEMNLAKLQEIGWRVKVIWLCELKNKKTFYSEEQVDETVRWIKES
jgi:DNA mismatch endonuclease (patch repair protein)